MLLFSFFLFSSFSICILSPTPLPSHLLTSCSPVIVISNRKLLIRSHWDTIEIYMKVCLKLLLRDIINTLKIFLILRMVQTLYLTTNLKLHCSRAREHPSEQNFQQAKLKEDSRVLLIILFQDR